MKQIDLVRVADDDLEAIERLVTESLSQGFSFVARLVNEYRNGGNCFNKNGEILLMAAIEGKAIAIAGLNQDPYACNPSIGRLRHLYVESVWRRCGVGSLLVSQIIYQASKHYKMLTLRTDNPEADKFYRTLGFKTNPPILHTTHYLELQRFT